ncbi:MAG TPA: Ig-like domain-containing protein [Candidatus Saccharimonadales bacterium]|nr:Ig-like domain-containing protein [Candidatus Saccharimonadales bacterium]
MLKLHAFRRKFSLLHISISTALLLSGALFLFTPKAVAAGCAMPSTDYGSATTTVTVGSTGTYNIWSLLNTANSANNSYLLDIDGASCTPVGGTSLTANTWTWVDYQNGSTTNKATVTLSAGQHTLKLIGNAANVKVGRILFLSDTCTPTGLGDNCLATADQTPPTVSLTSPTNNATVTNSTPITVTAADAVGVTKVELSIDGVLQTTLTASPYTYAWDTTSLANGAHSISAKAYDAAGNSSTDTVQVTVQNGDTQAPTTPTNLTATAPAYNKVSLKWTASTDNIGIANYRIVRNGTLIAQVSGTTYTDATVTAKTAYSYQLQAVDAAGNVSGLSATASVTTPSVPDTQAPSAPTNLSATAVSASQINVSWTASTDNTGVTGYDVYRSNGGSATKIATVTTTSLGDSALSANTAYTYYVIARDAAGNSSAPSSTAQATTQATPPTNNTGVLQGRVTNTSGTALKATIRVTLNGTTHNYGTDSQGNYLIGQLPAGTYRVHYSARGYTAQTYQLVITASTTTTKNVQLTK